jgi:hypothetical protein
MRAMGIRDKPIAPASPWQNPYVERLIGSIRRECLDHVIILNDSQHRQDPADQSSGDAQLRNPMVG